MTERKREAKGQYVRRRAGNGVAFALVAITVALGVMFVGQRDSVGVERNPHPKLDYEVSVRTTGAPEPLTPGSIRVTYAVSQSEPKACYYTDPIVGAPTNRPAAQTVDYPLQAVGEDLYKGVIQADAFQDSVYYHGYPACHWVVDHIAVTLRGKTQNVDIETGDWDHPETTDYFPKEPDTQRAKAGMNAGAPSRDLLYIPMPDIWSGQMKITPTSPQLPQFSAVAARRGGQFPPGILDPTAYMRDPLAYPKRQNAIEKMAKTGEAIQAVRSSDVGATLVIAGPAADDPAPSPKPRRLVIMSKDDTGNLVPIAQNDKLIPCSRCDDVLDDPASMLRPIGSAFVRRTFSDDYMSGKLDGFQVFVEGGSRHHWWRIYTFVRPGQQNDWMLFAAEMGVIDIITGERRETDLTPKDFGAIRFADFDPAALKQPAGP